MSNSHTPAPWHCTFGTDGAVIHNDVTIATIPIAAAAHKANARLIAAAPELLQELNDTLATLRGCFQTVNVMNRIKSIRAAITKATV